MKLSSYNELQMDKGTPMSTLEEISRVINTHLKKMYAFWEEICGILSEHGIIILKSFSELRGQERRFSADYFRSELFRVLTPLAVDPSHPFPRIGSNRLNLVLSLEGGNAAKISKAQKEEMYAFIEVPKVLPRFIRLPSGRKGAKRSPARFIPLEEIIKMRIKELFIGSKIKDVSAFTLIRNSELTIDEVASDNLLSAVEQELKNRPWGEVVCLHHKRSLPENIRLFLQRELDIEGYEMYPRDTLLNMQDLHQLYLELGAHFPHLRERPHLPRNALALAQGSQSIFEEIQKKERLFHHPYDSFQSVVELLNVAAKDPKVLAIKQTLYRTGKDSPFVHALMEAAQNGKQVTALVELRARFDEERNIAWAREMENQGVHVLYGLVGLKIHGKILQIVRREGNLIRSYTHLSTGNYNPATAKHYTDMALITAEPKINHDIANLFHSLTGVANFSHFSKIAVAPVNLRYYLLRLIQREIANAKKGKAALIQLKMNSLADPEMIIALYKASQSGVKIHLNVRGICCLRPGVPGISDNIKVVSIVGRFLEHSRIFYFENAAKPRIFLSSADWMPRNLNRRMEILFPIERPEHIEYLRSILELTFRDTYNARRLRTDGSYEKLHPKPEEFPFSSQAYLCEVAHKSVKKAAKEKRSSQSHGFQPMRNRKEKAVDSKLDTKEDTLP